MNPSPSPKPQSPYKLQSTSSLREVCFDASTQDFHDFKLRFPIHGSIDAICALLFYQFMQSAKLQLPMASSPEVEQENNERFTHMLSNLNFQF
jgi:hypothetical protein